MSEPSTARSRRSRRLRWARARWLPLIALAIAVPTGVVTTRSSLEWFRRPFPGFFVLSNHVVPTIGLYSWTGLRESLPFHARVVAVDERPIVTAADVYDHAAALPVGTPIRYALAKGDRLFAVTVPTMPFGARDYWLTLGVLIMNSVLSIGIGTVICLMRPAVPAARVFMILGFVTGLFGLTAPALYHPHYSWLSPVHLAMQAFFPATFIHFGLVFPDERPWLRHRSLWVVLAYGISAVLTAWALAGFYASPPRMTALYAAYRYSALSIVVLIGLLAHAYWENRLPAVRTRLRVVLLGLILGTVVSLFGFLNTAAYGGDFPINLIAITPVIFYSSLAYGIIKHDLFDIDTFIKHAAVYVTLTLGITAAYVASVASLGTLLPAQIVRASPAFNVAFVVLVAFLFQPLRTRMQDVIDRAFHRSRVDYRRTVLEVSAALTSVLDLDEILSRVGRTLAEGLQVRSVDVMLWSESDTQLWRRGPVQAELAEVVGPRLSAVRAQLTRTVGRPLTIESLEAVMSDVGAADRARAAAIAARAEMTSLEAVLVVPMVLARTVIGGFALGPKRSGRRFTRDELELLSTLAAESAVAIQNARSYRALKALNEHLEAKVQVRTAELQTSNAELAHAYDSLQAAQAQLVTTEKMASLGLVVAGVAHEINNPLSFIIGNVEPLNQTLARVSECAARYRDDELAAAVQRLMKILGLMALGADRTAAIVQDLRTFSRLGESQPRPTDLHDAIEVSLRLLRPRWADRITIHRQYGAVSPVTAVPGQINQVIMNVLANACDAISTHGNLWIGTVSEGMHVVITIRDDGGGIAPEHLARVFDPFFTTKPIGKGTGLGLAITHGIVSHHGGTIRATSELGKGTEFRIVLPSNGVESSEQTQIGPARAAGTGRT